MKAQTKCINCGSIFWSPAFKNKLKEVVALRNLCRKCENKLRHDTQINKNREDAEKKGQVYRPRVRSLEGIDERDLLLATLAQVEMERRAKEKKEKEVERQRQRTETQV